MWGSSRHMGAVDIFQDVYHPAVDSWLQPVESPHFLVRDLVSGEILHLAITSYANDVAKGTLQRWARAPADGCCGRHGSV